MNKLILGTMLAVGLCYGKTINLLNWKPQFKYTSNEIYTYEDAKQIRKADKRIQIRCEINKCRLYKTPLNCPEFRTDNMDEYLLDAFRARQVTDICFADYETTKYKYANDKLAIVFKRNNKKYMFEEVIDYTGDKFAKIYKIHRLSDSSQITWKTNNDF